MGAAEHVAAEQPERLTWDEIVARYPDQYVWLSDVERTAANNPPIASARVIDHGWTVTDWLSSEHYRATDELGFTGDCPRPWPHRRGMFIIEEPEPRVEPTVIIHDDDEIELVWP